MLELDDSVLLQEYVEHGSEEAFAALVARHVNKVYSIALRHTRNPHQAEEITQAVFVLLARKSRQLGKRVIISGWLCRTARLSSVSFLRSEIRRTRREQEAHMQNLLNESESEVWPQIASLLDAAMAALSEADQDAVALRFFDGKTMKEIGAALGASEDAVKVRVHRAVEKLRSYFSRRGIVCSAGALTAAISVNSVHAAPIGLAVTVSTAAAPAGLTLVATASTAATKAIAMTTMQKTLISGFVAFGCIVAVGIYLVQRATATVAPAMAVAGAASATGMGKTAIDGLPIKLANDSFNVGKDAFKDRFINEIDASTRRTTNSAPAGHIQCLMVPISPGSADYLRAAPAAMAPGPTGSRYVLHPIIQGSPLVGKRIRVSGWMKAEDVRNWAGVTVYVASMFGRIFASDSTFDRPIHGTTGWQRVSIVTDIPKEPCVLHLAPTLYGPGEIWCDDFQIDLVAPETPITDDRRWTVWSLDPNDYSETIDPNVKHEGRPAFRITYKGSGAAPKNAFVWWGQHNRELEKFQRYLGHTVRMSVWARTENVAINCGLNLEPKGAGGKRLADHSARKLKRQISGTTDWAEYSVTCWVPEETQDFQTGFFMFGGGTLWLDMDTFKCEIVETPSAGKQLP